MGEELPFRQVDGYPAQVNGPLVMARLLDGMGFRFHWATEGLTDRESEILRAWLVEQSG